jgi:hypothetical protein
LGIEAHAGRMHATSNAASRDASMVIVAVSFRPERLDQLDCSPESSALATGGASFGTWADQELVFTGTMVSVPAGIAVRRAKQAGRNRVEYVAVSSEKPGGPPVG